MQLLALVPASTSIPVHQPRSCFPNFRPLDLDRFGPKPVIDLPEQVQSALATLLPLLACGEEAAALAFDGLATTVGGELAGEALRAIAADERVHDAMLRQLVEAQPPAAGRPDILRAARRFHICLGRGGPAFHLARIAALDAAVCTVLSRLIGPENPLAADRWIAATLTHIRRDEARHVRVSRNLALGMAGHAACALRDVAAESRFALADVLLLGADAFETLGVDPKALDRDVRRLPRTLLRA